MVINSSTKQSTGYRPHELLYGTKLRQSFLFEILMVRIVGAVKAMARRRVTVAFGTERNVLLQEFRAFVE